MNSLFGKTLDELQEICLYTGLPKFAAKQIADWIYAKGVTEIDQMTNLSLKARESLKKEYNIGRSLPVDCQTSIDGTKKYLFHYQNNDFVEAVLIPEDERATLCVSTQVGCKMNCSFCATGKQGFTRNLSSLEIVNMVRSLPEYEKLTNIVYMGMGEPFDNYYNVMKSLEVLTSTWGLAMSPRRITVSTVGLHERTIEFLRDSNCHLALSLHNPFHSERARIMPVENSNYLEEIIEEIKQYDWKGQRRVSFEYILWKGLNDTPVHSRGLVKLLRGLECRVNLIRFHTIPDTLFQTADEETMIRFRDSLNEQGIICTIRSSRGEDILAACGLLSTKHLKGEE